MTKVDQAGTKALDSFLQNRRIGASRLSQSECNRQRRPFLGFHLEWKFAKAIESLACKSHPRVAFVFLGLEGSAVVDTLHKYLESNFLGLPELST